MKEEKDKLLSGSDFISNISGLGITDDEDDILKKRKKNFTGKNTVEDEMIDRIDNERKK